MEGEYGALETRGGQILQFVMNTGKRVALELLPLTLPLTELLTKAVMVFGL